MTKSTTPATAIEQHFKVAHTHSFFNRNGDGTFTGHIADPVRAKTFKEHFLAECTLLQPSTKYTTRGLNVVAAITSSPKKSKHMLFGWTLQVFKPSHSTRHSFRLETSKHAWFGHFSRALHEGETVGDYLHGLLNACTMPVVSPQVADTELAPLTASEYAQFGELLKRLQHFGTLDKPVPSGQVGQVCYTFKCPSTGQELTCAAVGSEELRVLEILSRASFEYEARIVAQAEGKGELVRACYGRMKTHADELGAYVYSLLGIKDEILCDVCGTPLTTFDSAFHYTGILNGKPSPHIHLCAAHALGLPNVVVATNTKPKVDGVLGN